MHARGRQKSLAKYATYTTTRAFKYVTTGRSGRSSLKEKNHLHMSTHQLTALAIVGRQLNLHTDYTTANTFLPTSFSQFVC